MKKLLALVMTLCMTFGLTACKSTEYETFTLLPNEFLTGESLDENGNVEEALHQYTVEDIQNMNGGKANMVFGNEGYLSFLQGRFSEEKIEDVYDYNEVLESIRPMAELLGMSAGADFVAVYGCKDSAGYVYYTYQQRYGDSTVYGSGLKIIIDPEGYPAGLSCTFQPNIGYGESTTDIGPEAAEALVKEKFASLNLTVYSEATHKLIYPLDGQMYDAYAVYTNNPNPGSENFDLKYYEHFVSVEGELLSGNPTVSFGTGNTDSNRTEEYFDSLVSTDQQFTVTTYDGKTETITVPVAYNSTNGKYYLASVERKMAVGYYDDITNYGVATFVESDNGTDWRNNDLLTYDRYIKAYDFYASFGFDSVDGMGVPILIATQMDIDNACYCNIRYGWAVFAASDLNYFSEAMDVVGHEYTHGYTGNTLTMTIYQGNYGAINEAFSDIIGNMMEMSYGMTDDTQWLLGENSGMTLRSMSNPHAFYQPVDIWDEYYADTTQTDYEHDYGGVHTNNSLLSQMAYKLYVQGLGITDQCNLWMRAIEMLTGKSDYPEVLAALEFSIDINGIDSSYKEFLEEAFLEAGLISGR